MQYRHFTCEKKSSFH